MMRSLRLTCWWIFVGLVTSLCGATKPEAVLIVLGDQHSGYERTAQVVALVDRIKAEHTDVPLAVLIDGDAFEYGNAVARRSGGAIDFAMFAALARRAPTVINLGNHEPEFAGMAQTVERLRATGAIVIGNAVDRATQQSFASPSTQLRLAGLAITVVGIATNDLATYRAAVRPELALAEPVAWTKQHLPELLGGRTPSIILSHAGLAADRAILPFVPSGTLFAGAHDHLRFVHRAEDGTVYLHSGSWNAAASIVRVMRRDAGKLIWEVEQRRIAPSDPADPELARVIDETFAKFMTAEDRAVVGRTLRSLDPTEAAQFAVDALRKAAGVDAAFVGGTTFGAGLPAGDVSRYAFDACVRFDGGISIGEVDGITLKAILMRAAQDEHTAWADRTGENLIASTIPHIADAQRYRIAVSDWIARNPKKYLGTGAIQLTSRPDLKLKAIVEAALTDGADGGR